jgi:hypothetical protein
MHAPARPGTDLPALSARGFWILFALVALLGAGVRVTDSAAFRRTGFDEALYRRYVNLMDGGEQAATVFQRDRSTKEFRMRLNSSGAATMPGLVQFFLQTQRAEGTECELPPTRFLYIYTSWLWKRAQFGDAPPLPASEMAKSGMTEDRSLDADHRDPALVSLHRVACLFSGMLMLAGGLFAWRLLGRAAGLGVLALVAFAPMQIHFSQHALIDGFFAFWAAMCLWTTWECLRNPRSAGWLSVHTVSLALMVLTKENAFFVYCALALATLANRWLHFGSVTPRFVLLSIAGPLIGIATLVSLAGGIAPFVEVYQILIAKAQTLTYARMTGDGPWHRYLLDLMTVSPIVLCLAIGALFALASEKTEVAFLAVFVAGSYALMCNLPNGMNLRYASIWDLPLRAAAFCMIWRMCGRFGQRQWLAATIAVAGLCAYDLRQYVILATNPDLPLYELIPADLLRLVRILKVG